MHWLREITKAKLSLSEPSQVWVILGKFGKLGQVRASLGKPGQVESIRAIAK